MHFDAVALAVVEGLVAELVEIEVGAELAVDAGQEVEIELRGYAGGVIIGVDVIKDAKILNAAYDDAAGVTAKFNLNLLARINRELGADFDLSAFSHEAFYNAERRRIEMHLASRRRQKVRVAGRAIDFRAGETIHTENSYKYTIESFGALARGAGWTQAAVWTDDKGYFSVQALVVAP